jgi:hypothetical protein
MANAKITALTSNTTPALTDVLAIVDDPGGSPLTQKITLGTMLAVASPTFNTPIIDNPNVTTGLTVSSGLTITTGGISNTGGIIVFPAAQVASAGANSLDDYEEGTWTPVLTCATPGTLSVAYSVQSGRYTKIGRFVHVSCYITTSTWTLGTASGNLQVTGLPFTSTNENPHGQGACREVGYTKANYTQLTADVTNNATLVTFLATGSAQVSSSLAVTECTSGTQQTVQFTLNYFASA